ncbi:MAG: hypothetical protein LBE36_06325 [Flavobacteriaceae bacterium]|jgi:hypothetical protein|nr:hypothetical protein [Flavobacteriaceae bacterium]
MSKKITVAKSWSELNQWQREEIAHLYLHVDPEKFEGAYLQMIFILFQKRDKFFAKLRLFSLLRNVPISSLEPFARFLIETTDFYSFPEIKGLIKPSDRLGNITIKQFSVIDTFFDAYSKDKTELNIRRFTASLYRIKEKFDELDLPKVAEITDKISVKKMESIALAYQFTRMLIWDKYPVIFPKPKQETEEEKLKPIFKKKEQQYIPFEKIITGIAMDELQPLGKKQDVNKTRIYEFLSVLSESILYHKEKQKAYDKAK